MKIVFEIAVAQKARTRYQTFEGVVDPNRQSTSRFLAQERGGGGGILKCQEGASRFFTNNMIFLECGVIALFEAFYMFRDHNHVKMKF